MKARIVLWNTVLAGLALAVCPFSQAQNDGLPGPEHRRLQALTGTFTARVKAYFAPGKAPEESSGEITRTMIYGGRYLQEMYKGQMAGKPFNGMSLIGYDRNLRKYRIVWVDSASTDMMINTGVWDDANRSFVFESILEPLDASKPKARARDVLRIVDTNQQVFTMYRQALSAKDTKEIKMLEIVYTRK